MGTNFYTKENLTDSMSPKYHIGKRSAAGLYCWDCGTTLCKDGEGKVHYCRKGDDLSGPETEWHRKCPKCGKSPTEEKLTEGAAGRELGFNKGKPEKKTGVASCSSFSWVISPEELDKRYKYRPFKYIYNEYGDKFTLKEFKEILKECPIQYMKIGEQFS